MRLGAPGADIGLRMKRFSEDELHRTAQLLATCSMSKKQETERRRAWLEDRLDDALCWLRLSYKSRADRRSGGDGFGSMFDRCYLRPNTKIESPEDIASEYRRSGWIALPEAEHKDISLESITPDILDAPLSLCALSEMDTGYRFDGVAPARPVLVKGGRIAHRLALGTAEIAATGVFGWTGFMPIVWVGDSISTSSWWMSRKANDVGAIRPLRRSTADALRVLATEKLEERYEWHVDIRWGSCPAIRMATDSVGARELFALRDIPDGAKRRAALRHWVRGHWRQRRDDSDKNWVRQHLRGATKFEWAGYSCELYPSRYETEQATIADLSSKIGIEADVMRKEVDRLRAGGYRTFVDALKALARDEVSISNLGVRS